MVIFISLRNYQRFVKICVCIEKCRMIAINLKTRKLCIERSKLKDSEEDGEILEVFSTLKREL